MNSTATTKKKKKRGWGVKEAEEVLSDKINTEDTQNLKPNQNLQGGRNGLVVHKQGQEVGDGGKIDSCV